ncbi:MAG TPA: PadR family transcriptional regulator [Chloroflexota bacterium]
MYEFLVLAQLAKAPMHGYMIAKVIDATMGPFRQVQWGALYPVLNRLELEGLICSEPSEEDEGRSKKVFTITGAGEERLHELVMDTSRHQGEYGVLFMQKVALFFRLTPEERLYLCRHYAVHAQQNLDHLRRKRSDVLATPLLPDDRKRWILAVIDHRLEHWQAERLWVEDLIAQRVPTEVTG